MSAISLKSITGITSITTPAGVDNVFTVHTNDTTERFRIDQTGNQNIVGIVTVTKDLDVDGHTNLDNVSIAGVSTFSDDVTLQTANSNNILLDKSDNSLKFGNSTYAKFGGAGELMIYHDGTYSVIKDNNSSPFNFEATGTITFAKAGLSETYAKMIPDGAVELYYDNDLHFATTSQGCKTNGDLSIQGDNGAEQALFDVSDGSLKFVDNIKAKFGSNQELSIHSSGSDSFFENSVGHTYFRNSSGTSGGLLFRSDGETHISNYAANEYRIKTFNQGAVELYFAAGTFSTPKLKTSATGITVDGEIVASQDYPNVKPTFDFNFAKVKKLDTRLRCFRSGGSTYVDEFGYIKNASYNAPRFDHDPITKECKGLLIEPSRENKISYSHAYSPSGTGTVDSYTEETRSPDGEYNAKKITRSATGGGYNEGTSTTGVFSVFLKAGSTNYVQLQGGGVGMNNSNIGPYTKNTVINLSNGTFTVNEQGFTAKQYRDGWWRVSVVYTTGSTYQGTSWSIYCLDSSSPNPDTVADEHCYAWGQVFEVGSFITSYIPSGPNSQNTRGVERVRIGNTEKYNDLTDMFNAEEGTVITEHEILSTTSNQGVITFAKNFSSDDRIEVRAQGNNTNRARFEVVNTSSSVVSMNGSNLSHSGVGINNNTKSAFAFKTNDYAGVVNGGSAQTDTSGNIPTGLNTALIGYTTFGVQSHLYIKRLTLYSQRLSNNQMQNLTS